jgi:lysophospholipase L1-like esterase
VLLKPGNRILFIGDSITDCGRRRPIGEGSGARALGDGYVSLVQAALLAGYADYGLHVINMGVAGDTVHNLRDRWDSDVMALRPDWLSIFIGINDAWRWTTDAFGPAERVEVTDYATTLRDLIARTQPWLTGLILMMPYTLQPDRSDPLRRTMDEFGAAVRQQAASSGAVLADTQAAFDRVMAWVDPLELSGDRVHVALAGHMVLARAVLDSLQYDWRRMPPSDRMGGTQ